MYCMCSKPRLTASFSHARNLHHDDAPVTQKDEKNTKPETKNAKCFKIEDDNTN